MNSATSEMHQKIKDTNFKDPRVSIISNVTASPTNNSVEIKKLLVDQIEKPVRWRESVINMIKFGTNKFIEVTFNGSNSSLLKHYL